MPESFSILRTLLARIEDPATGEMTKDFQVEIPEKNVKQVQQAAEVLKDSVFDKFPFLDKVKPMSNQEDPVKRAEELLINNMWKTNITYVGADGLPFLDKAGNVLRPETAVRLSMRTAPTLDVEKACENLKEILTKDPPYGAKVDVNIRAFAPGMSVPDLEIALRKAIVAASFKYFGNKAQCYAAGGTIPITKTLADAVKK